MPQVQVLPGADSIIFNSNQISKFQSTIHHYHKNQYENVEVISFLISNYILLVIILQLLPCFI